MQATCEPNSSREGRAALAPWHWLSDAIEFRRLRRRLPNAHRAWSNASGKLRPESDAEYLARLRILAREREQLLNRKLGAITSAAAPQPVKPSGPLERIVNDLRDALEAAEELPSATATPALEGAVDQARSLLARLTQRRDSERRD